MAYTFKKRHVIFTLVFIWAIYHAIFPPLSPKFNPDTGENMGLWAELQSYTDKYFIDKYGESSFMMGMVIQFGPNVLE